MVSSSQPIIFLDFFVLITCSAVLIITLFRKFKVPPLYLHLSLSTSPISIIFFFILCDINLSPQSRSSGIPTQVELLRVNLKMFLEAEMNEKEICSGSGKKVD